MSETEMPPQLIASDSQTSEADLENGCWLFFARELENRTATPETVGYPLTFLVASFLTSDEFKAKLGFVDGALTVSETMLLQLRPDLITWLISIVGSDIIQEGKSIDRLTMIRKFLNDDRTREAVYAVGSQHIHEVDALNAALASIDEIVALVGASALFDGSFYRRQLFAGTRVVDLALHYVLYGERLGLKPSLAFDAGIYAELNSDVAVTDLNRLFHYEMWGRREGRAYRPWPADHAMPPVAIGSGRPTVLLLLHEATYTGAPILGWNLVQALSVHCNIVVVLRRGGALEGALRDVAAAVVAAPPFEATLAPHLMDPFAERLTAVYQPLYAIANSVESRSIATALRRYDIPIVALIHEFWAGATPNTQLDFYAACGALVFPAHVVEQSSLRAFRETGLQNRFILPQGPCAVPPFDRSEMPATFGAPFVAEDATPASLDELLADGPRGTAPFTVIGLGAVEMRKGIDLFVSVATGMRAKYPDIAFRFIWIGTWEHAIGSQYAALLEEQVRRASLADRLHFFPPVDNLESVYARADALFLSSRLDPLPNITIDAAVSGVPVVCFDRASGTAELMAADQDTASLVVPHLDAAAAVDRIAELALNSDFWTSSSAAMQRFARRAFDMIAYARAIDAIGRGAAQKFRNTEEDRRLIDAADLFDASIYFGSDQHVPPAGTGSAVYLDQTRHINFALPPVFGVILRRPRAGFHPFIYGKEAPDFPLDGSRDPLAHYIERGMPEGRWTHSVLRPDLINENRDVAHTGPENAFSIRKCRSPISVALHGHFHYPDNIADFMSALDANKLQVDLFLTTTSAEVAENLRTATKAYDKGSVVVEIGPNVGRDIYAFLRVLRTHIEGRYELVGHIHGKRSVHTFTFDPEYGDRWRRFLWEHLLGPSYPTADLIIEVMQSDCRLGLVFPESGALIGWEKNADSAAALALRLGLHEALPPDIEFPAGTMFWARVTALEKLARADLLEEEMPAEPVTIDGTILHALERMLPILCEEAGYNYSTTYIPHISR